MTQTEDEAPPTLDVDRLDVLPAADTAPPSPGAAPDAWHGLRRLTPARIALGRAGTSLPTAVQLDFQFAHAQARDAVHLAFDTAAMARQLADRGLASLCLDSAAGDRHTYLQRPDLGRQLDSASAALLDEQVDAAGCDLVVVIADGLSALAVERHGLPMLQHIEALASAEGWRLAPICLVRQSRVALADEVGQRLKTRMVVMLIGERPGLSSPDSLGLYFTYAPRVGLTDAARNCISNVRLDGLSYAMAAHTLRYLMREACVRQRSGVSLKDEAQVPQLSAHATSGPGNFLLEGPGLASTDTPEEGA